MFDFEDLLNNTISDVTAKPQYPDAIGVELSLDLNTDLFDTTDEQYNAIAEAMLRAIRMLETDVATILNYKNPEASQSC